MKDQKKNVDISKLWIRRVQLGHFRDSRKTTLSFKY